MKNLRPAKLFWMGLLLGAIAPLALAQQPAQPGAQPSAAPAAAQPAGTEDPPSFSREELDQMLAPLALYPDDLLAQVLMASTYPLEVVAADRWVKANKDLKDEALADAVYKQTWDESVKSLVNVPDVLAMMSEKLEWTQKMGDAVIAQQKDVMDAVQRLRGKAKETGKLESNDQQKVEVQQTGASQTIVIESSNPDVIYVPSYDSTVVYGSWPYPSYPPYPYYPPGYVAGGVLAFGAGVACGAIWANACGNCNWGGGDIDIDINKNINRDSNRTRNTERAANRQSGDRGAGNRQGGGNRAGGQSSGKWQHNSSHRGSVPYRNNSTAQKYGGKSAGQAAQSRQDFRGKSGAGAGTRPSTGAQRPSTGASRAGTGNAGTRPSSSSSNRGGALQGASGGGQAARSQSSRGQSSRSSAASSSSRSSAGRSSSSGSRSSGASRSSGSRSSGGGSRGGGGGRGGGRR